MKLLRYGPKGQEKPGTLDAEGRIRDLSGVVADITPDQLWGEGLAALKAIDPETLPLVEGQPRYGVPVNGVRKFIAIGLNFADHAAESNLPIPAEPVVFTKAVSCLTGPNDTVVIPRGSEKTDWEVELGIVIGKRASYVEQADALDHVAGYVLINDVSERAFQTERGGTWDKGKGCDTFGPTGPWLVTKDEIPDPQQLRLWLEVDGHRYQNGSTATMISAVRTLVNEAGIPLQHALRMATLNPAKLIGVESRLGTIENGKEGNLVILNQDLTVRKTFVRGNLVYS